MWSVSIVFVFRNHFFLLAHHNFDTCTSCQLNPVAFIFKGWGCLSGCLFTLNGQDHHFRILHTNFSNCTKFHRNLPTFNFEGWGCLSVCLFILRTRDHHSRYLHPNFSNYTDFHCNPTTFNFEDWGDGCGRLPLFSSFGTIISIISALYLVSVPNFNLIR